MLCFLLLLACVSAEHPKPIAGLGARVCKHLLIKQATCESFHVDPELMGVVDEHAVHHDGDKTKAAESLCEDAMALVRSALDDAQLSALRSDAHHARQWCNGHFNADTGKAYARMKDKIYHNSPKIDL
uniref:Uncharacterized protein n=1 Tax=Calcidiscus leptoporus TaxID=127549 RepID=A0A7S0ISF0_9EUKA|mmetsp:Transcript_20454/g.47184  ORF Transcript_20454/g.47184 Transcript_20454/m.47184 type:complete len:128 (+) Transcript_20454:25-408(+)